MLESVHYNITCRLALYFHKKVFNAYVLMNNNINENIIIHITFVVKRYQMSYISYYAHFNYIHNKSFNILQYQPQLRVLGL